MKFRTEKNMRNQTHISSVVPSQYRDILIPFANILYTEGPFGNIFSQEIVARYYTMEYHHFDIRENTALYGSVDDQTYSLSYQLQGNVSDAILSEEFIVKENYYYLFNMQGIACKALYTAGVYDTFEINVNPKYLETYVRQYPRLEKVLNLIKEGNNNKAKYTAQISYAVRNIIHQIIRCRDDRLESDLLRNKLINELIIFFLRDIQMVTDPGSHQRKINTHMINEIEHYILNHIEDELTIKSLARHFCVSAASLRRHFTRHTNMAVHEFIVDQRMKRAAHLLSEKMLIKEVAKLTGYSDLQTFSRAFSACYGMTPGQYRQTFEQK